ncbi:MAG: quinoprotein dehydrogenase-associated putative ABC transporter substrate-binding protein [Acidobacteria bacterium]|nr:MAG: quinoprotein dehydrogenase-associated putative ABC transporter substrate-binding protein [Acidobacteriota bacterium]
MLLVIGCTPNTGGERRTENGERVLRVCADPNNLPYSNSRQEGFENKIASLIARDLGAHVEYSWWPQRRGFVRNTLRAGACDCIIGVPSNFELALPTQPYYRSSYVFVSRRDRHLDITSLDDRRLEKLKIGVQMIGNDHYNSPPAHALTNRGMIDNIVGYTVYGDYRDPEPGRAIVDAVARGDVDVAIVWGPQAGYFAKHARVALDLRPVNPQIDVPFLPFVFEISMGVRRGDSALRDQLDREIEHRRGDIERILDAYGVPRV